MNDTTTASPRPRLLGLPLLALAGLALLAAPRVVLHDLGLIEEGTFLNLVLVVVPIVIWIAVTVGARVRHPFLTVLVTGGIYGLYLAISHNLFWHVTFGGRGPSLGGNLAGRLDPVAEELVLRGAATISSLFTGIAIGAVAGLVAWGLNALVHRGSRP